jgi:excisionase family DNA binding protein
VGRTLIDAGKARTVEDTPRNRDRAAELRAILDAALHERSSDPGQAGDFEYFLLKVFEYVEAGRTPVLMVMDEVLSPEEAGEFLGVSRPTVYRLMDDGVLTYRQVPNSQRRMIALSAVRELQARRERNREGLRRMQEIADAYEIED